MKMELTLPALERLIAGDNELEVGLRVQIVKEFAKRHLMGIISTEMQAEFDKYIREQINVVFKELTDVERVAASNVWPTVTVRLRSMVEEIVSSCIETHVRDRVNAERHFVEDRITKAAQRHMEKYTEVEIQKLVQERFNAAVQAMAKQGGV
jgi:hypothetical protein